MERRIYDKHSIDVQVHLPIARSLLYAVADVVLNYEQMWHDTNSTHKNVFPLYDANNNVILALNSLDVLETFKEF